MQNYRSLNSYLRERFGEKVYKLALDGGFTCPTRDGKLDTRGCIFCAGGSGDFATPVGNNLPEAIEKAKMLVARKSGSKFVAYFQSFTGTYAPIDRLNYIYYETVRQPDIVAISIGTRPDCLPEDVLNLLSKLNTIKPVWVELGLQTIHPTSAEYIRRGYSLAVYNEAVQRLKERKIEVVVHMILGLPSETPEMMEETASYIGHSGADGIKFQLLHVLKGTDLAEAYAVGQFRVMSLEEYIQVLERCIQSIPPEMIVHRITGDGAKISLIAPQWSADKKTVLNAIQRAFEKDGIIQGSNYNP